MQEYGYMFNKMSKDVKKFTSAPSLNIKKTNKDIFLVIGCLVLFVIAYRLC